MITVLNLKVLLELKVVVLSRHGLLAGLSKDFLSFFFRYKLRAFVAKHLRRSPGKCPVEYGGQGDGHSQTLVCGVVQVLPLRIEKLNKCPNLFERSN